MPTARLSQFDKDTIKNELQQVVWRTVDADPFPIENSDDHEDFRDFIVSLVDPKVMAAFELLKHTDPHLVSDRFNVKMILEGPDCYGEYTSGRYGISGRIRCGKSVPALDVFKIPTTHPKYEEVLDWAMKAQARRRVACKAQCYIAEAVERCTSAGQVKRLLPDCMKYVPDYLTNTLGAAERQSRIPANFCIDKEVEKLTLELMALGSLIKNRTYEEERLLITLSSYESSGPRIGEDS